METVDIFERCAMVILRNVLSRKFDFKEGDI
jgi:hypothetical protein